MTDERMDELTQEQKQRVWDVFKTIPLSQCTLSDGLFAVYAAGMADAREALEASERLRKGFYTNWSSAGGGEQCKHGFNVGIPCPRCDEETVAAALSPQPGTPAQEPAANYVSFPQSGATMKCMSCGTQQWPQCPTCGAMMVEHAPAQPETRPASGRVFLEARDAQWESAIRDLALNSAGALDNLTWSAETVGEVVAMLHERLLPAKEDPAVEAVQKVFSVTNACPGDEFIAEIVAAVRAADAK